MTIPTTVFEARFPNMGVSLFSGTPNAEVTNWSIASDFLTPTDGWSLKCLDLRDEPRWYETQPVELYVDGRLQLIGRCDKTERGGRSSEITLTGRDYLADLTTCSIDPTFSVRAGMLLDAAILTAAGPAGITAIDGPMERNGARTGGLGGTATAFTAKQLKDIKPGDGDSIFSWCNKVATRQGWTIQPANRREAVVLQRPTYGQPAIGRIVSRRRGPGAVANMLIDGAGVASRDYTNIPSYFLLTGQQGSAKEKRTKIHLFREMVKVANTIGGEFGKIVSEMQVGRRIPREVVGKAIENNWLYRLRVIKDKKAKTQEEVNAAAARIIATALKESLEYTCTVRGTADPASGMTWATDCEVEVDDDIARVHERLWIASRTLVGSPQGTTTQLKCWRPRSFQIDPESLNG